MYLVTQNFLTSVQSMGEWLYPRNRVLPFFCVGFYLVAFVLYTRDPPWDLISPWMWNRAYRKLVVCRHCFKDFEGNYHFNRLEVSHPVLVFYAESLTSCL